jgi:hypothetical protein
VNKKEAKKTLIFGGLRRVGCLGSGLDSSRACVCMRYLAAEIGF